MLDLNFVRENPEAVSKALRQRGMDPSVDRVLALDTDRREHLQKIESLKKTRNESSRKIGEIMKSGGDAGLLRDEMKEVGAQISQLETELESIQGDLQGRLGDLPNLPHESVPEGRSAEDNPVVRTWGEPPEFSFEARAHWTLGPELGILDFERAAKISGARFALYLGDGALLERALIQFMLDVHTRDHGYTEVLPPFMVNAAALVGTGQLPKFEEDLFKVEPGGFYLIPTAEVPLTNIHREEILDGDRLPLAYCAYTPCFRSEAGSYGKDVRGLIRQHQFNKVELVRFSKPDDSYEQLETLTSHAEEILKRLGLHYRVVTLCTGDLGFGSAKTFDLEVWLPGQNLYREISSCSNFDAFQARRAQIRYRAAKGEKARPLHTLNGSALAVGRTLVAILENYQQADGTVVVPEALRPYMHGKDRITAREV
jgi:seryl-tRNA synthetase